MYKNVKKCLVANGEMPGRKLLPNKLCSKHFIFCSGQFTSVNEHSLIFQLNLKERGMIGEHDLMYIKISSLKNSKYSLGYSLNRISDFLFLFVYLFVFWDRVSLCSPG